MSRQTLRPGTASPEVRELQRLLQERLQLDPPLAIDGHFGPLTLEAVYALQASHIGPDGRPLTVDGVVGPVTWWALTTENQTGAFGGPTGAFVMPARTPLGRLAITCARGEMVSGAREMGENNAGPFVEKYLAPIDRKTGAWCAGFVSYCVRTAAAELRESMPFDYSGTARGILAQLEQTNEPMAGDLAFWWRVAPTSWQGHVEIVTHVADGVLWTIGGNRGRYPAPVRAFSYVIERESKMLGFAKLESK